MSFSPAGHFGGVYHQNFVQRNPSTIRCNAGIREQAEKDCNTSKVSLVIDICSVVDDAHHCYIFKYE